jgi:hypothetical protein
MEDAELDISLIWHLSSLLFIGLISLECFNALMELRGKTTHEPSSRILFRLAFLASTIIVSLLISQIIYTTSNWKYIFSLLVLLLFTTSHFIYYNSKGMELQENDQLNEGDSKLDKEDNGGSKLVIKRLLNILFTNKPADDPKQ